MYSEDGLGHCRARSLSNIYTFLSFINFQARRHTQSSLCNSTGILIEALQYIQYRRLWFASFLRISRSRCKAVESSSELLPASAGSPVAFTRSDALLLPLRLSAI